MTRGGDVEILKFQKVFPLNALFSKPTMSLFYFKANLKLDFFIYNWNNADNMFHEGKTALYTISSSRKASCIWLKV